MARMHSRKKGKSGSSKPLRKEKPAWLRYEAKEIESLIQKLAKEGYSPSLIGIHLRDVYGIPDVNSACGKSITTILDEANLSKELPADILDLIKKAVMIRKHLESNHKDEPAKRGLILTESKIKRLLKYYKSEGKVEESFKYDPKKAAMFIE